jgi:hypothetical protein
MQSNTAKSAKFPTLTRIDRKDSNDIADLVGKAMYVANRNIVIVSKRSNVLRTFSKTLRLYEVIYDSVYSAVKGFAREVL